MSPHGRDGGGGWTPYNLGIDRDTWIRQFYQNLFCLAALDRKKMLFSNCLITRFNKLLVQMASIPNYLISSILFYLLHFQFIMIQWPTQGRLTKNIIFLVIGPLRWGGGGKRLETNKKKRKKKKKKGQKGVPGP